jgi:hypothetical protein
MTGKCRSSDVPREVLEWKSSRAISRRFTQPVDLDMPSHAFASSDLHKQITGKHDDSVEVSIPTISIHRIFEYFCQKTLKFFIKSNSESAIPEMPGTFGSIQIGAHRNFQLSP